MITLRETTVSNIPKNVDAVVHAMKSLIDTVAGMLERLREGDLHRPRRMRMISSRDATLTRLAESPHTTVCLSSDELEQARAIEREARQDSSPAAV